MSLIKPEWMDFALKYLAESGEAAAAAKAERIRAEHGVKIAKARALLDAEGTAQIRDAMAVASKEYAIAVEREAEAVRQDEWHRTQRNKADAIIEAWRTENANRRAGSQFR